ncbi:MAG: hypothetical protein ABIH68_08670 [bacterium]
MSKQGEEIKTDIEEHLKNWRKVLDEKDAKISRLIDENRILKSEVTRKIVFRPALKDRIMDDVNRILSKMRTDLRRSKTNENDLQMKFEALKNKHAASLAEIASQNKTIENLRKEIEVSSKEYKLELAEKIDVQRKELQKKFEERLRAQADDAQKQIDELMKLISE